jgi:predicted AlkP superfamily pyrophosphatase or phosphodiesterase
MNAILRRFAVLPAVFTAALAILAGCAATAPAPVAKPRLVVLLVVDGLPQRQVVGYRDHLAPDGLNRFLERGAWFADAHYGYSHTVTAAGHATMLTGAYPHRSGIIGNEWRNPATGETEYNTQDPAHAYLGHKTARLAGTSPKNLEAESLGDVLRRLDARSKVIAISGKDRGAILPAGRAGTAYMYMAQTGQFVTSTYYMKEHPAWVTAFNAAKPADRFFKSSWTPLLPEMAYARSVPDGQPWFAKGGKLPMQMSRGLDEPGPLYYEGLAISPFLDALTLDFARAAIEGEGLGADDVPDILCVSLSSHDYINHGFGAESRLSHDHLLQLDMLFQSFFRDLDRLVGAGNYLAVLTADHGFMPAPGYSKSIGRDAGTISSTQSIARLNAGLARKFGEGNWALAWSAHAVALNAPLLAQKGVDRRELEEEARRLLLAEEGIAAVFTRTELEGSATPDRPFLAQVRNTWHRERSADLQVVLKPYWMFSSSSSATTHGSPHSYDTHVPLLFYGPRWVKPGRIDAHAQVADLAPTLARILGVPPPASSEGRALVLAP